MNELSCDLLVIGGGAAGSRAAYEAKRARPGLDVLLAVAGGFGLEREHEPHRLRKPRHQRAFQFCSRRRQPGHLL